MSDELLPCPFCGAKAEIEEDGLGGTSIRCDNWECMVHVEYTHHVRREEAITDWNRRAVPDTIAQLRADNAALHQQIAALRAELGEVRALIVTPEQIAALKILLAIADADLPTYDGTPMQFKINQAYHMWAQIYDEHSKRVAQAEG